MKKSALILLMFFGGAIFAQQPKFKDCLGSSDANACNVQKLQEFRTKATRLIRESVGYQVSDSIYFKFKVDKNGKLKVLESFALLSKMAILNTLPAFKTLGKEMMPTEDQFYEWSFNIDLDSQYEDFPSFDEVNNYPEIGACRSFNEKGERACFRYVVYRAKQQMEDEGVTDNAEFRIYLQNSKVVFVEPLRLPLNKTLADRVATTLRSEINEMTTAISRDNADDFYVEIEFNAAGDSLKRWKKSMERLDYLKSLKNTDPFVEEILMVRKANFKESRGEGNVFFLEQLKRVGIDTLSRIETSKGFISIDSLRNFKDYEVGDESDITSFNLVESVPVWDGCEESLGDDDALKACFNRGIQMFIAKNFNYPNEARKKRIQGRVYVNFVIEKDGNISFVEVVRGTHMLLDLESIRVISQLPDVYKPAIQRGKPVRMSFVMPINAKLK